MKLCYKENFNQLFDAIGRIEKYLGTTENTEENTITWILNKIKEKVDSVYTYESENKEINHVIEHDLDSFFINVNILAERERLLRKYLM